MLVIFVYNGSEAIHRGYRELSSLFAKRYFRNPKNKYAGKCKRLVKRPARNNFTTARNKFLTRVRVKNFIAGFQKTSSDKLECVHSSLCIVYTYIRPENLSLLMRKCGKLIVNISSKNMRICFAIAEYTLPTLTYTFKIFLRVLWFTTDNEYDIQSFYIFCQGEMIM